MVLSVCCVEFITCLAESTRTDSRFGAIKVASAAMGRLPAGHRGTAPRHALMDDQIGNWRRFYHNQPSPAGVGLRRSWCSPLVRFGKNPYPGIAPTPTTVIGARQ
jgi:hypothetical protein